MALVISPNLTQRQYYWNTWKIAQSSRQLVTQYEDDGTAYTIFGHDGPEIILCVIYKGNVPTSVQDAGYSQAQNDIDKTDFETNFKPFANTSVSKSVLDSRYIHKFGNMALTSSVEFTVSGRPYVDPGGQAQRSVISTSAQDGPAGSGARAVRLIYLDNNYVRHIEDIVLMGIAGVNTVGTNIHWVEDFYVTQGTNAVGRVFLATGVLGTGSDIVAIAPATTQMFGCHHYVPSGSVCYVMGWGGITDRDVKFRLRTQYRSGSFLVDAVADTDEVYGFVPSGLLYGRAVVDHSYKGGIRLDPQTYVRVTVQASGTYSTNVSTYLDLWEEPSGSTV